MFQQFSRKQVPLNTSQTKTPTNRTSSKKRVDTKLRKVVLGTDEVVQGSKAPISASRF